MRYEKGQYRSFIDCSLAEKLLFTGYLLLTGIAYLMAMYYLYTSHQGHDGKPGDSIEDIVETYYGNRSGTKLEAAIRGPMAAYIEIEDRHVIVEWLKKDAPKEDYPSKIQPILAKTCLQCHSPSSGLKIPDLSNYSGIRKVAKVDTGESLHTLVKLSHIHLFGIGLVLFILGSIFKLTVLPGWLKYPLIVIPFFAVFVDILSWFLTKWDPVYAYTVVVAGAFLGISLGAQIMISLYQIWFLRPELIVSEKVTKPVIKNKNSIVKTYQVVIGICLVASFLVSITVVKLTPRQKENQRLEKIKNILSVVQLYDENTDVDAIYRQNIFKQWVELETGQIVYDNVSQLEKRSFEQLAKSSEYGESLPSAVDIANIKRQPKFMPVYYVLDSTHKCNSF